MPSLLFIAAAFLLTSLVLWCGRRLALNMGFADAPGGRKKHEDLVPPIGGLGIIPVFLLCAWGAGLSDVVPWPLASGLAMLLIVGAIDDAFPIKSYIKFAVMILVAAFVVIFGNMQIATLGNLFGFGDVTLEFMSKGFTILSLALLMNSINMMDGVDGLAGGFCSLVTFWLMIACAGIGNWPAFAALAILLACLLGFLGFNMRAPWRKKASIFMGDSGALCLGLLLGWFCISLSQGAEIALKPVTVIWIIAIPVMDAFALFLARSLRGLHPFNADRRHLHHRFLDAGISPSVTTTLILSLISLFAFIGFAAQFYGVPAYVLFYGWMVVFILHTAGIIHPRGYTMLTRNLRGKGRVRRPTKCE